jgi:hypothetical protein
MTLDSQIPLHWAGVISLGKYNIAVITNFNLNMNLETNC